MIKALRITGALGRSFCLGKIYSLMLTKILSNEDQTGNSLSRCEFHKIINLDFSSILLFLSAHAHASHFIPLFSIVQYGVIPFSLHLKIISAHLISAKMVQMKHRQTVLTFNIGFSPSCAFRRIFSKNKKIFPYTAYIFSSSESLQLLISFLRNV